MPMSDALFSTLDVELEADARPGYRLAALELYNWGTFDGRIETLRLDGHNALVTGDIGSGKSTLVDAVTTLLLPANRINYNKAAGADTRERSLRTYVLGHYRSERNETTGTSRPVGLRDHHNYSVVLGRFRNEGHDATVTLAQVFWMPSGGEHQPRRFFVTHDAALSIRPDFTDFGSDPADLKRRLRSAGADVVDHYPRYGTQLRRLLGIRSEQALELFHQTISMKSVGNLTDFVRAHMLEPADAGSRIATLVQHFEDLTRAHDAVRKARDQLEGLQPIITALDEHDRLTAALAEHAAASEALRLWVAEHRRQLLAEEEARLTSVKEEATALAEQASAEVTRLEESLAGLRQARDGFAGGRLAVIESEIRALVERRDDRRARGAAYAELLAAVGLPPVEDRVAFERTRAEVASIQERAEQRREVETNAVTDATVAVRDLQERSGELRADIAAMQGREGNIDRRARALRDRLAEALGLDEHDLPFVGELIQVRPEQAQWRGAAERVLRGFALSVLVPTEHYQDATRWVDRQHLRGRFVYFRVGDAVRRRQPPLTEHPLLRDVLEVKPGRYADWLDGELLTRADHVTLDDTGDFGIHRRAVTRRGQVKADRRHEKDDRFAVDDPTRWVLGWSNADKLDALVAAGARVTGELAAARDRLDQAKRQSDRSREHDVAVQGLLAYQDWSRLDWQQCATAISTLEAERDELSRGNTEMVAILDGIEHTTRALSDAREHAREATKRVGGIEQELAQVADAQAADVDWMSGIGEPERERHRHAYPLVQRYGSAPRTLAECGHVEREVRDRLAAVTREDQQRQSTADQRAVRHMVAFRAQWPADTVELGTDVASGAEYRELTDRISGDDLPRFEAEFKKQLNTNTINDIAGFQAWLDQSAQTIRSRIRTIDESLGAIDYNPGTRITLLTEPTENREVREFRQDLRACTDDALSGDDQYSEERFRKVSAIVERFRGRPGLTDADRRWTAMVTDVRTWFVFAASERERASGAEREHYTDADGKSGGQKEKLAYTILAASLAYQFGLEWGVSVSRDFRFTVIDEAFGRGSDASTRYALDLFGKLGLQLLVVTPLQKVHVIEPYVSAVGFVENRSGQRSRLQTLTIEEYRDERERRVLVGEASA